jgi:hypothetical protein
VSQRQRSVCQLDLFRSSPTHNSLAHRPTVLSARTVYKVGPRPSMAGYKAADWGEQSFMWEGRLRIVESGKGAVLKLEVSRTIVLALL